jgi:isochorismate synthase EntC
MMIGAGCGVVAESQMRNEWNEINLKMQSIKEMLGI